MDWYTVANNFMILTAFLGVLTFIFALRYITKNQKGSAIFDIFIICLLIYFLIKIGFIPNPIDYFNADDLKIIGIIIISVVIFYVAASYDLFNWRITISMDDAERVALEYCKKRKYPLDEGDMVIEYPIRSRFEEIDKDVSGNIKVNGVFHIRLRGLKDRLITVKRTVSWWSPKAEVISDITYDARINLDRIEKAIRNIGGETDPEKAQILKKSVVGETSEDKRNIV